MTWTLGLLDTFALKIEKRHDERKKRKMKGSKSGSIKTNVR